MKKSTSQVISPSPSWPILVENLDNFWLFQGVSAQDAKIKSLLLRIAQPQNVGKINVTLFTFILPTFRGSVMAFFTRPYFCNLSTLTT